MSDLERLDERLALVVPHMDVSVVERGQHPGLGRVEVAALDPVRPGRQATLDVQAERLKRRTEQ